MAKLSLSTEEIIRLHNEIRLAEKRNENELLPKIQKNLARYTGSFIPRFAEDWDILLNEIYPIVQFNIPSVFFRNPRAFIKPRQKTFIAKRRNPQTGNMEEVVLDSGKAAKTQEAILNYSLSEINYKRETRKVLFDALISPHGILWHGYKGEFGMTDEQSLFIKNEQIFVKRVSPMRFLFDPSVNMSNLDEGRWVARSFDIPLEDLLDDEELDVDKRAIKGFLGFGERVKTKDILDQMKTGGEDKLSTSSRTQPLIDFADSEFRKSRASRFIRIYEMFRRPSKKERNNGEKGKIILLTNEQKKPLRINNWLYKAEGFPSKPLQFNELPDDTFGLDDISTYESIVDNKNIIRNIQIRNANEHTKTWVALAKDGTNEEDIEKIKVGENTIVLFEGDTVTGKMSVASPGAGASSELYLVDQRIDRELQDKSGVTDLKKGFLQSGEESAASVQLRAAGASVRPAFRQDLMADFIKDSLHYLNQLLKQFMPFKEAVRISGTLDIEWSENPSKEEIQADTDVDIDAISMLPENPEKEVRELQTILQLMVEAVNNPNVANKLAQEGYTFNLNPIIASLLMRLKVKDPDVFRRIKQDESLGFVSAAELRAAQANVDAAISGQPVPSPPQEGQDHKARLAIYTAINSLLTALQQQSEVLTALIQAQQAIAQAEQEKQSPSISQSAGKSVSKPEAIGSIGATT